MPKDLFGGESRRKARMGLILNRPATTISTGGNAIFNVLEGRVVLTSIVGEVTVAIEAQACNTKLQGNPTTGSTVDICATLDITGDGIGTLYGITGTFANAMQGGEEGATGTPTLPVVLAIGTLDLNCSATNTGEIKWSITYMPLDDDAYMTVA